MKKPLRILVLASLLPFAALAAFAEDQSQPGNGMGPVILNRSDERMLVVTMTGDPEKVAGLAYRNLYQAFFRFAGRIEKKERKAPRARWQLWQDGAAKSSWVGKYALPISDAFPEIRSGNITVETWEYGMVAEILHVGPYSAEAPAIARLKAYIAANGYSIIGDHEEEYRRGPGIYFKGKPEKYRTLIRYRIRKTDGTGRAPIADSRGKR